MLAAIIHDMCRRLVSLAVSAGALLQGRRAPCVQRRQSVAADVVASEDSLTKEQLARMLGEVRAHYKLPFKAAPTSDAAVAEMARVRKSLYRTRFDDLKLDRCEARASTKHGRGLFATRDIEEGELCTLYPGDALLLWPDADPANRKTNCELNALFGKHVTMEEQTSSSLFLRNQDARGYELPASKTLSVVGDPARDNDAAYLGHFASDGASVTAGDTTARDAYAMSSAAAANAEHVTVEGAHFATVATRAILKGAEVLVSYGEGYWFTRSGFALPPAPAAGKASKKKPSASRGGGGFGG